MPGYILHLTEAKLIIDELQQEGYRFSDAWANEFLLGNLLPDTKRKKEKITSHFWNPDSLEQQAIAPDLQLFLGKYRDRLTGPLMLGYLAHLYLDACFVNTYWPSMWNFRDAEGREQTLQSRIRQVWLKKRQLMIPVADFFSGDYYYGDYSRMNAYLLHKYRITVPAYDPDLVCPIREVDPEDLKEVLAELQYLCETIKPGAEKNLAVFDLDSLEEFISLTAQSMAAKLMDSYLPDDALLQANAPLL